MECKEKIISVDDYIQPPRWEMQRRKRGNQATRSRNQYADLLTAFDIETTRITDIEQSVMYIWQWQIGFDYTVVGRTWDDFKRMARKLCKPLRDGQYIVVWVHNLSYEFQFLRGIYDFRPDEVFAIDSRKVLKCTMYNHLEFRCSYLHSNMNLDTYTGKMGAAHKKLSGAEFDYTKRRWWYTQLTPRELEYCVNDVRGLVEALHIEMQHDGDNLYTVPLTSTGYVRRDCKAAMRAIPHGYIQSIAPNVEIYTLLREAFCGGDTHANRGFAGEIVDNVQSWDRSSSYPDVLCNCKFPITEFLPEPECTPERFLDLVYKRGKAILARVAFYNIRLRNDWWGAPYIHISKCRHLTGETNRNNPTRDNGRVLQAHYLEMTLTDIDMQIILEQYDFDSAQPMCIYSARYGKLPQPIIDLNIEYYRRKTELKGVPGQELMYMKSKNKLNSIYGMMAQNPVKQTIDFTGGEFVERSEDIGELLDAYNKKAFLAYQWGVWCTAWARLRLQEGIRIAGEGFIYCDTDSVKFIGRGKFGAYNARRRRDSKKSGAYAADPSGKLHYMGVYEQEESYKQFCTLGAKKYCYTYADGKLHATIAGVSKRDGGKELQRAGGITAFKEGFVFHDAGGTESIYNDDPEIKEYINEDGRRIPITSNVVIRDSTYTLGITAEYARLLEYYADYADCFIDND